MYRIDKIMSNEGIVALEINLSRIRINKIDTNHYVHLCDIETGETVLADLQEVIDKRNQIYGIFYLKKSLICNALTYAEYALLNCIEFSGIGIYKPRGIRFGSCGLTNGDGFSAMIDKDCSPLVKDDNYKYFELMQDGGLGEIRFHIAEYYSGNVAHYIMRVIGMMQKGELRYKLPSLWLDMENKTIYIPVDYSVTATKGIFMKYTITDTVLFSKIAMFSGVNI